MDSKQGIVLLETSLKTGMRVEVENVESKIRWFADVEIVSPHNVGVLVEGPSRWGQLIFDRKTGMTRSQEFKIVRVL